MREMKESGIECIGLIPDNWNVKRLKYVSNSISKGNGITKEDVVENGDTPCVRYGEIYSRYSYGFDECVTKTDIGKIETPKYFSYGYILFAGTGELIEEIGKSIVYLGKSRCLAGGDIIIVSHSQNPSFLGYAVGSVYAQIQKSAGKAKLKVVHISPSEIGNILVVLPPMSEQRAIAAYLDKKCAEIDSLTAGIQTQIDTLEQYKRSVITEAVTKGLNPGAEMKESGAGWLGKIPKHWKVDKLKFHLKRNEPRNPGGKEILSLYRDYGIVIKDSRDDNHNVTSDDTSNYKYVRPGDFVVNKMKAWQGSVAVSKYEGIVSPAYFVYNFTDDIFYKPYFHFLLRSCYQEEFRRLSGGIRVGQWDLPSSALDNTVILIPPYDEQVTIANILDAKVTEIDSIIEAKKEQLSVVDEYKKSLIFEYVTGKKEVPTNE